MTEKKRTDDEPTPEQQPTDGGPGSHNPGGSGGVVDDPASGGVSDEQDSPHLETDVHGETDQVS